MTYDVSLEAVTHTHTHTCILIEAIKTIALLIIFKM